MSGHEPVAAQALPDIGTPLLSPFQLRRVRDFQYWPVYVFFCSNRIFRREIGTPICLLTAQGAPKCFDVHRAWRKIHDSRTLLPAGECWRLIGAILHLRRLGWAFRSSWQHDFFAEAQRDNVVRVRPS
jgi:hypothetical protein